MVGERLAAGVHDVRVGLASWWGFVASVGAGHPSVPRAARLLRACANSGQELSCPSILTSKDAVKSRRPVVGGPFPVLSTSAPEPEDRAGHQGIMTSTRVLSPALTKKSCL